MRLRIACALLLLLTACADREAPPAPAASPAAPPAAAPAPARGGRIDYQAEPVSMQDIISRIVDSQRREISHCHAEVKVESLPNALGDAGAIEQVFANLLTNAVKYLSPERPGKIVVGAVDPDSAHSPSNTYFVRDNGLGIPEMGQEKLFRAFERLHPRVADGEGMGLAIAKRIIERHGGKIWAESSPGEGSTFFVTLPCG